MLQPTVTITPEEALKATRRVIGFANQGAMPSQTVIKRTLSQLDRALPPTEAVQSRALLAEIVAKNVLPSQKVTADAYNETSSLLKQYKVQRAQRNDEIDNNDEEEGDKPSMS